MKIGLPNPNRVLAILPYRGDEDDPEVLLERDGDGFRLIADVPLSHTALWKEALSLAARRGGVRGAIQKRPLGITRGLEADSIVIFALEVKACVGETKPLLTWRKLSEASKDLAPEIYQFLAVLPRRSRMVSRRADGG